MCVHYVLVSPSTRTSDQYTIQEEIVHVRDIHVHMRDVKGLGVTDGIVNISINTITPCMSM